MEVTDFKSEVEIDLRGCLEAAMASEATKMAVRGYMHMDTRVIEVADFNSEVKFDLMLFEGRHGLRGHLNTM